MKETDWAYLAGMIDGEGYIGILRHYKKDGKVSKRGYEVESKLCVASMNKPGLVAIQKVLQLGHIHTKIHMRMNNETNEGYELRFYPNQQRVIYPKVIPYLIQKKEKAKIIMKFLDYRTEHKGEKCSPETEKFYLDIEEEFRNAVIAEKPWLLKTVVSRVGHLSSRNQNLVKAFQTHTYIRNPYRVNKKKDQSTEVAKNK